ncbi:Uncharacterised protein [Mycobacterium tuberculosis]|nr:Uncharacterised protein [Mycobacterium tuberculosis]
MSAARIGPTVWELDGPMPILKMSKAESISASCPHPLMQEAAA